MTVERWSTYIFDGYLKTKSTLKKIERSFELSMKIEKLTVYEIPFRE